MTYAAEVNAERPETGDGLQSCWARTRASALSLHTTAGTRLPGPRFPDPAESGDGPFPDPDPGQSGIGNRASGTPKIGETGDPIPDSRLALNRDPEMGDFPIRFP